MGKGPATPLETFMDPLKFYNHGDNPAMKNFMTIAMENAREGKIIDHRTFFIDKGQRYDLHDLGTCSQETGMTFYKEISEQPHSLELWAFSSAILCYSLLGPESLAIFSLSASMESAQSRKLLFITTLGTWEGQEP